MKNVDLRKIAIIMVSCVLAVSVICLGVVLVVFNLPEDVPAPEVTAAVTSSPTAAEPVTTAPLPVPTAVGTTVGEYTAPGSTAAQTEPSSAPTDAAPVPQSLSSVLANSGYAVEWIDSLDAGQLVTVISSGSYAQISLFERTDTGWTEDTSLRCQGYIGEAGAVTEMSGVLNGTPAGVFPIGNAFYQYYRPHTGLNTFAITEDTYWVNDPNSGYYHCMAVGTENQDWNSAERMKDNRNYQYGFLINYNVNADYNKGAAVFFCIGGTPTGGGVATSEDMVLAYLSRLSAERNPHILIY